MSPELELLRDEMRRGFADIRERLDRVDQRLDRVDQRLDRVEQRLDGVEQRLERVEQRLDGVHQRLHRLEEQVRQNGVLIDAVHRDVRGLAEAHVVLDERVERYRGESGAAHQATQGLIRLTYRDLRRRIGRVEARPRGENPASN